MNRPKYRPLLFGLFILSLLAFAGCTDDSKKLPVVNSETQLRGQLTPTAGVSTNEAFVLSGRLNAGLREVTITNEKYSLTIKQGHSQAID